MFSLVQKRKIGGATSYPRLMWKIAVKTIYVCFAISRISFVTKTLPFLTSHTVKANLCFCTAIIV